MRADEWLENNDGSSRRCQTTPVLPGLTTTNES
jgi:hypothetical protein